jgi:hypothetical protein
MAGSFFRWCVESHPSSTFLTMCIPADQDAPSFFLGYLHQYPGSWVDSRSFSQYHIQIALNIVNSIYCSKESHLFRLVCCQIF